MTKQLTYEPMRIIDSATFTGSFQVFGTPLTHPASLIKVVNLSLVAVTVSIDGTTAVDIVPAGGFFLYDITSNSPINSNQDSVYFRQGLQFYINGAASTGSVYLVVLYNNQT